MQSPRREGSDTATRARSHGTSQIDVVVLTSDPALLATLREAAGTGYRFFTAQTPEAAIELLSAGHQGLLVLDVADVRRDLGVIVDKLRAQFPQVVLLATGGRDEQSAVASLVSAGRIYRFLHQPASPARAEMFLSAAARRHEELQGSGSGAIAIIKRAVQPRNRSALVGSAALVLAAIGTWSFWPARRDAPTDVASEAPPIASAESIAPAPTSPSIEAPSIAPQAPSSATDTLARADAAFAAGRFVSPASDNALDLYRSALREDPTNTRARARADEILDTVEQHVESAIARNDVREATNSLASLQSNAPDHPKLRALQDRVAALSRPIPAPAPAAIAPPPPASPPQRSARTRAPNVELARAHLAAGELIEPQETNALAQLRRARAAGEDESAVQIAATDLGTQLLNRSLGALSSNDLAQARQLYDAAANVDREFETALPDIDLVGTRLREAETKAARERALDDALARVAKLRASGRLIEPAGDNAYEVMKQLIADAGESSEVRIERERLSAALLEHTRTALVANDIDRADVLATRAEEVLPGLPQTRALREQIGAARQQRDEANTVLQAATLRRRREVPAVYPREALLAGTQGWVDIEFTIGIDGVPTDLSVKRSQPERIFDVAALQALRQWRFEPIVRDGIPRARRAALRIEFKLK